MIVAAALMMLAMQAGDAPAPPSGAAQDQPPPPQIEAPGAATKAATQWLALVDGGDLARSWQAAGSLFRSRVTQAAWTQQLGQARTPMGAVTSRQPDGEEPISMLPGVPTGSYRILQFDTNFANHLNAVETVVMVEEAGAWRAAGYFIADAADADGPAGSSPPPAPTRR